MVTDGVTALRSGAPATLANTGAEQAILGAMLINNAAHGRVSDFLLPEHFANAVHGRIYAAIGKLIDRGQVASPVTLKNLFDQDDALAEVGGSAYLAHLAASAVTIINAESYGRIIRDLHLRRELIMVGQQLVDDALTIDLDRPAAHIAADLERQLSSRAATARGGIELVPLAAMRPNLEAHYLIKGLFNSSAMAVIYGESGCGKTWLAVHLGLAVASGQPFFGRRTRAAPVVYIAAEAGPSVESRVVAAKAAAGLSDTVPFSAIVSTVDLCRTGVDIDRVAAACRRAQISPGLVIVDTLSRAFGGGNENAPDDMGAFVANVDRLRRLLGCAVLIVHHTGKESARGARGHSLLHAATDTEAELTRDESSGVSTLRVTKQRDLPCEGLFAFTLKSVPLGIDDEGDELTSCVIRPTDDVPGAASRIRLTDDERAYLGDITNYFARSEITLERVIPSSGNVAVMAATRLHIRDWLKHCGRFGVADDGALSATDRSTLSRNLNRLRDKGKIGMTERHIWLLK